MTTQFLKGFGAAGLLGVLAILSVPAQAADVSVNVPFGFSVSGRSLPRGAYTLSSQGLGSLLVRGQKDGAVTVATRVSGQANTPKLVFHRIGEQYILREVWMESSIGYSLAEPRLEREAMQAAREGKASARLEPVEIPLP